jgi:hypothetical protein
MDARSGNRFMRRSVCVPLPTPGAPTRMTRAARDRLWRDMVAECGVRSTEGAMARNVQRRVEVAAAGQRRRKTVVLEEIHQEGCARVGVLKKG